MKRILLPLLFFYSTFLFSQTTVQIGTGTSLPAVTLLGPVCRATQAVSNPYARCNMLFTANELSEAGIPTGSVITEIAFYKGNTTYTIGASLRSGIYMANSARTVLPAGQRWDSIQNTHIRADTSTGRTITTNIGWVSFPLSTPFTYDGNALEIATEIYIASGGTTSGGFRWQYTGTQGTSASLIVGTLDQSMALSNTNADYKNRPNIRITYTPPPCLFYPQMGFTTSNKVYSCSGDTLQIHAINFGSGTPQWESASDSIGPYTPIPNQMGYALFTTQTATNWYRCVYSCMGFPSVTLPVKVISAGTPFSGVITIDTAQQLSLTNFHSLTTLVTQLNCKGISGPLTINFAPYNKTYTERVDFTGIYGTSPTSPITINGNGNTLSNAVGSVLSFSGSSYIIVDSLNILVNPGGEMGIVFNNQSHHIDIRNSKIEFALPFSSTSTAIAISGSSGASKVAGNNASFITIEKNTIVYGAHGIVFYGTTNYAGNTNNAILNNRILRVSSNAIAIKNGEGIRVQRNDIDKVGYDDPRGYHYYGIIIEQSRAVKIHSNKIHSSSAVHWTTGYAITIINCDNQPGSESEIINNLIFDLGYNSFFGIYSTTTSFKGFTIYHNTIRHNVPASSYQAVYGVYLTIAPTNVSFLNNIIDIKGKGDGTKTGIYMQVASSPGFVSDHNIINIATTTKNNVGYKNGYKITLADWISGSNLDSNSYAEDPTFFRWTSNNYGTFNLVTDSMGIPVGVLTDMNGVTRNTLHPDIGAVEFTIPLCSQVSTTGTITSSAIRTCLNELFTTTIPAPEKDYLLRYQWQSAPDSTGPYINHTNDTTTNAILKQTNTRWYRMQYTCQSAQFSSPAISVFTQVGIPAAITINTAIPESNTNYHSLSGMMDDLHCHGIGVPTTITFAPNQAVFTDTVRFDSIPGLTATNTLTIKGNGNTIAGKQSPIVQLSNIDYLIWDSLDVRVDSSEGIGMLITSGAQNITVRNCKIDLGSASKLSSSIGIRAFTNQNIYPNIKERNITIENNYIIGGYKGFESLTANYSVFKNNIVREFDACGVSFSGSYIQILNNDISRGNRVSASNFNGIEAGGDSVDIISNKIHKSGKAIYHANGMTVSVTKGNITNNIIYNIDHIAGEFYGINLFYSSKINIYHNTIAYQDGPENTNRVFGIGGYGAPSNIVCKNNIISLKGLGYGARTGWNFPTTASSYSSNYNCLYISGRIQSYISTWGNSSKVYGSSGGSFDGNDINTAFNNPQFLNDTSITPLGGVDNFGTNIGISTDINGATRTLSTPDFGAIEYTLYPCTSPPVAGTTYTNTVATCINKEVRLWFDPKQTTFGTGQTYQWETASDSIGPYIPIANSNNYSAAVQQSVLRWYRVALTCNAVTRYTIPAKVYTDTGGVSPSITIDTAQAISASNYHSLSAVITDMHCRGIKQPTTITFAPHNAIFYEAITLSGSIIGLSAANTLTIYGNGNTLISNTTPAVKFLQASYISIDSLKMVTNSTDQPAVFISSASHHLNISNSHIIATKSYCGGIVSSGSVTSPTQSGNNGTYLTIENNRITGGRYGIALVGDNYLYGEKQVVKNNIIEDFGNYGMYIRDSDSSSYENNEIHRKGLSTAGSFYGISIETSKRIRVNANRIHTIGPGVYDAYGIFIRNCISVAGTEVIISNNAIYNINHTKGNFYGVYTESNLSHFRFYHNTISYRYFNTEAYTNARGFYFNSSLNNVFVRNNILSFSGKGKLTKTGIYVYNMPTGVFQSDKNIVFLEAGSTNYFGYWNRTNLVTQNDWRLASSNDSLSLTIDPAFLSDTSVTPLSSSIDNKGIQVGIVSDLNNTTRSLSTPDIGAIEFNAPLYDIKIQSAELAHSGACYSTNDPLRIKLQNLVLDTVNFSTHPLTIRWNVIGPVNSGGIIVVNNGKLPYGATWTIDTSIVNRNSAGTYLLSLHIEPNPVNLVAQNDSVFNVSSTIRPIFKISPKSTTIANLADTIVMTATGPSIRTGKTYFSEICLGRGDASVWPSYLTAHNFLEITGVPNSNLEGYILEEWIGSALFHSATLPAYTKFSQSGTMIIAIGGVISTLPDINNSYYYSGNEFFHQPLQAMGFVLRDASGNIVDAVVYGYYIFPAGSGVTPAHWSGINPTSGYTGIRLTADDNNTSSGWIATTQTIRQNPNTINSYLTVPIPSPVPGLSWKYLGSQVSDTSLLKVGPFTQSGTYQYMVSYTSACGNYYDTASVIVSATVPVTLTIFGARAVDHDALLNWETASELNNSHFELQRSKDGMAFETIATIKGKGNCLTKTAYAYQDINVSTLASSLYYRLKQVDFDNKETFSVVSRVYFEQTKKHSIKLSPNPFSTELFLSVEGFDQPTEFTVRVTDIQGRTIAETRLTTNGASPALSMNMTTLENGLYFIQILYNNNVVTQKVIKN